VKHSTFLSLTAAVSLAACHDATAPEQKPEPAEAPAGAALVAAVDSSAEWASLALDDAATRLLSGLDDGEARRTLERALHALSANLGRRDDAAAARGFHEAALGALAHLRDLSDVAAAPDLDAIALAIDGAARLLDGHQNRRQ
jgi:hypothetical protein